MTANARSQAFFLLNKLQQRKHTLDYYLEELDRKAVITDKRERALFNALVFGILRQRARLDYVLKQFSSKPLADLDTEVLNLLRLALFQMMFMDKIPESAAVNTAVEIAKKYKPKASGFVNAVLRKSAAGHSLVKLPDECQNIIQYLSVKHALPQWLTARWLKRFGRENLERLATDINMLPPLSLRVNTLKTNLNALQQQLAAMAEKIETGEYCPATLNLLKTNRPVPELPGYNEGFFIVQDQAAQLTVALIDPQPDESILDTCAGIGGKALGMSIAAENRAKILATDVTAAKLNRIKEESLRLGLIPPETQTLNWLKPLPEISAALTDFKGQPRMFDKVLVDAPCSGLGVLRRNPDTKWSARESDFKDLARRQLAILQKAAAFVKPGGVLVYTVCSTEPEETTAIWEKFMENNHTFIMDNETGALPKTFAAATMLEKRGFCTYPSCNAMDGFFMMRLKKQS